MIQPTRALCLLVLSVSGWGQAVSPAPVQDVDQAQQPVTTLKVVTGLVAISAVVNSKDGETKTGLTKDDFVLKQDGKEEPIRYFSRGSDLPLSFALMVDTSGSQQTFIGDEALASDVVFETMLSRKEDRAMLVQFDSGVVQLKSMTNSASALHFALSRVSQRGAGAGGTLLYDAIYAMPSDMYGDTTNPGPWFLYHKGSCVRVYRLFLYHQDRHGCHARTMAKPARTSMLINKRRFFKNTFIDSSGGMDSMQATRRIAVRM